MAKAKAKTDAEKLKEINEQSKKLREEAKALRESQNAGKAERIAANKIRATARKTVRTSKTEVRELAAAIYSEFSTGDPKSIGKLADQLMEASTKLVEAVRSFATADEQAAEDEDDL